MTGARDDTSGPHVTPRGPPATLRRVRSPATGVVPTAALTPGQERS